MWCLPNVRTHIVRVQPMTPDLGVVDPNINKLARYRASKSGKSGKNAARDFHRFIHRDGQTFPAKITTHEVPIRKRVKTTHGKRRTQERLVKYPVILLSSWIKSILETYPKFLFGGYDPFDTLGQQHYMQMFSDFWKNFKMVRPDHEIYQRSEADRRVTIPIAIHGDEGRGLGKSPVLIISYQVMIPYSGPNELNSSKHLIEVIVFVCCTCFQHLQKI